MERPQSILDIESQDPPPSYNSAIRTSFLLSTITTSTVEPAIPPNPVTSTSNPPYPVTPILIGPPYPVTPDFGQPPYPIPHEQDPLGPGSRSSMYESTEVPFPMPMPMLTPVRMPMPESPLSSSSRNQNFVRLLDCEERTSPFSLSPPVRNSTDSQSSVVDPLVRRKQIALRRPSTSVTESSNQRKKEICISCCITLVVFNIVTVTVVLIIIWIFNYHKLRSF